MDINRRGFILCSAAVATLAGCATSKTGLRELKPGEKLRVGAIGCGIPRLEHRGLTARAAS